MPLSLTGFNTFVPKTVIESAKVNENFNAFRGHLIPVTDNTATSSDNTYDLGTATWRWKNLNMGGALILGGLTTAANPPAGGLSIYNKLGTITIRDDAGNEEGLGGYSPSWEKYTLAKTDMIGATSAVQGVLFVAQPNTVIHGYRVKTTEAFGGGSISAVSFDLGQLLVFPDRYVDGYLLSDGVTTTNQVLSGELDVLDATTSIAWEAIVTGGTFANLTTGALSIWILKSTLP